MQDIIEGAGAVIAGTLTLSAIGGMLGRRRAAYTATPRQLDAARRALRHFGSYSAMARAATVDEHGVRVLRVPDDPTN